MAAKVNLNPPPYDMEAEQAVLGSMLIERWALDKGLELLKPTDFYRECHAIIFDALRTLAEHNVPPDLITLQEELRSRGKLEDCGGTEYLMALIDVVPTAANIEHYARIVLDKSWLRRMQCVARELLNRTSRDSAEAEEVKAWLLEQIERNGASQDLLGAGRLVSLQELLHTPCPEPEWIVEPLIPAQSICLLAGDSGIGKSWIAAHIALCVAAGIPVFGRFPTSCRNVLVCDAEQSQPLVARRTHRLFTGLCLEHKLDDDLPVEVFHGAFRLDKPEDVGRMVQWLKQRDIGLVIADPLIECYPPGTDENSATSTAVYLERVRQVVHKAGCAVLFVHHVRKMSAVGNTAGERLRGSTAIKAALDSFVFLRRVKGQTLLVEHDKSRYAPPVEPFVLTISDPDESSTVVAYEGQAEESAAQTDAAKAFIERALADAGGPLPRKTLLELARNENFRERTVERALREQVESGLLAKTRDGNAVIYSLRLQEELWTE
jgi:hypothetical protein